MASRDDAVPVEGKQKKNSVAEGRNRQALGDIGNLVTVRGVDGKPQPRITRPITRSFCAQLLANAQAAAAENNKKPLCVNLDGVAASKRAAKAAQKKVVVNPKPAEVIEISPDTKEGVKKEQLVNREKTGEGSSKKKVQTLTSVLTTRSKYACGITAKPKEKITDIDAADAVNELAAVEYVEDIYKFEISPDTKEDVKKEQLVNRKKTGEGSSKKKVQTLTSVLTARSKYACGITAKPKEKITDIDAADAENELAAVEYVEDIYKFYKLIENESQPHDYMHSQPEINDKMRSILVDWLIEVHNKFDLMPETLYLTINIIDRFLAKKIVPRKQLQLVGISAMLTASKYEEIWSPEVNDFVCISDRAFTHEQILTMEKTILGKLEWTLTVPTLYVFLVRFIKASMPEPDQEMENLVYFLAELGMMHYVTVMYCPSMVAASAVYAARCTLKKTPVWNATLQLHTGFSETQLNQCARLLANFHGMAAAAESKLKVVQRKYLNPERGAVALLPPAKILLELV